MAQNLKRKRANELVPRKTRKISPPEDEQINGGAELSGDEDVDQDSDGAEEEVDEWGGISQPQASQNTLAFEDHQPGSKPKKPPTGEELRAIKDAADLYRSGSFKLQIDALLPNVRPKTKRIPPVERLLLSLHSCLMNIPTVAPQHPLHAARSLLKKGVSVPYSQPLPTEDTNWKVAFQNPSEITLVGSWANKLSTKGQDGVKFGIDLAVEMPADLFQEKDYLNGRFFHKRAFYLATIAAALNDPKNDLDVEVSYQSLSNDTRLTKLVLDSSKGESPNGLKKLNAQICIIPVLPAQSPIALHRLSPSHSNIRISSSGDENASNQLPTPTYNTCLLTALTPRSHLLAAHALKEKSAAFSDALSLLRVWANQRGYGEGSRMCVRGFDGKGPWWSALLELLINGEQPLGQGQGKGNGPKRRPLGRGLSSYQLFRAALDFLGKHDFETDPVFLKTSEGHKYAPETYRSSHHAVFVDSSSTVNLLADVPLGSLHLLRHDARKTLDKLNSPSAGSDPFTAVFLTEQRDLPARFDAVIRVDLSSVRPRNSSAHSALDAGSTTNALMSSLASLLGEGLGNRTKAVAILHPSPSSRPLSQAHPSSPHVIHIGLIYNAEHAFRQVDHGPAATETDTSIAQRFRDFWGDKAELRRFKDGSITESVVWEVKTADERAHIPTMVVRHILEHHFGLEEAAVQAWQAPFDALLRLPESVSGMYLESGLPMGFKGAMGAYDALVKNVKALDEQLPLSLLNVSAVSEQLRYTSVFAPLPLPVSLASSLPRNARYLHPIEIVLEFEKSSKWPDDLKAIQKVKLAFFERIAAVLMSSVEGLKATVVVGDEKETSDIMDQARLEIVTPQGWAFWARIWHDREATLLDRIIDNKNSLPHITVKNQETSKKGKEYYAAVEAKEVYLRRFIYAPQHHRAIAKLCHHFTAYAGTVRLVKRWLASHWLLHGHIGEEVVELICASFFVKDGWERAIDQATNGTELSGVPASKERGFAAVVEFLKDWAWEDGLFVPLYGPQSAESLVSAGKVAVGSSGGVWAVKTEVDAEGHAWSSHGPDLVVARRVSALAAATWECLQGMEHGKMSAQSMFLHPTEDYDFVIRLDPGVLPRYYQNIAVDTDKLSRRGKYSNLASEEAGALVRPGFDPARLFFEDIQRVYTDTFKIFYDPLGGDSLGGVWDPSLKQPKPFRVLGGYSTLPCSTDGEKGKQKDLVALNEASITTEIERLGAGLIKKIVVQVR